MRFTATSSAGCEAFLPDGRPGVTFVVPVYGADTTLRAALAAILLQADGRPMEVVVVDDGGGPGNRQEISREFGDRVLAIRSARRGAAAAVNSGIRAARFPVICQVDQDVVLDPGWMRALVAALSCPGTGAAQGYYRTDPAAPLLARVMGRDLEQRYARMRGCDTTHVCTGNSAYWRQALIDVGLFDERLGYGYDNDMSYRLQQAGFRLAFCREARSVHRWRTGLRDYLRQQFGVGYGRLDVVARHPARFAGDSVSPAAMMVHPVLLGLSAAAAALVPLLWATGLPASGALWTSGLLLGALVVERTIAGVRAAVRFRDVAPLLFPAVHLARDAAWLAACVVWAVRRLARQPGQPWHSMWRQPEAGRRPQDGAGPWR
jgi:hypothetical protein